MDTWHGAEHVWGIQGLVITDRAHHPEMLEQRVPGIRVMTIGEWRGRDRS